MATPATSEKTYQVRCHCGLTEFPITIPEITSKDHPIYDCNCSICSDRAALFAFVSKASLAGVGEKLTSYRWGKKVMDWRFCGVCGSTVMVLPDEGDVCGVNVRIFEPTPEPTTPRNGNGTDGFCRHVV